MINANAISTSNLMPEEQQVVIVAAKRREEAAAMAQAAAATTQRGQEALLITVTTVHKALDESRTHKHAATESWENEKTIARLLERQLAAAQVVETFHHEDDACSKDVDYAPDVTIYHLHAQVAGFQNIRLVVTIVLEPLSYHNKWCRDLMLITVRRYVLDDHVLSNVIDTSTYWARLDNIVLTWILGILSVELHDIVGEPS
jgi:hypothetical protein